MTKKMFIVFGLVFLLTGIVILITNLSISENESIQQAARITQGEDGQKMYTMTGADMHNAAHRRNVMNAARANKRLIGIVLALPGLILLIAGIAIGATVRKETGIIPEE